METRLYRALPEHLGPAVQPPDSDESGDPLITCVCLEREADPDANNNLGYDFWGAHSEDSLALDAWEEKNSGSLVRIEYAEFPNPITFYPHPFSDATLSPVRARDDQGRFIADDPATPDVNEAWV
jgi:hypothetical protein